jgi:tetratricopeptide (TPR) repeat protein
LYGKLGKAAESERCLQKAVSLDPNDETTLSNLGLLAFRKQDYQAGLQCYERLLKLNPWDAPSYGPYAEMLAATGDLRAARAAAERGLELDPTFYPLRRAAAKFSERMGNLDESRRQLRLAEEIRAQLAPWDAKHQARLREKLQQNSRVGR